MEIEDVVAPVFHKYVYGVIPPVAEAVAAPFLDPLHVIAVDTALAIIAVAGCSIVILLLEEFAGIASSVTVTLYVPTARLVRS